MTAFLWTIAVLSVLSIAADLERLYNHAFSIAPATAVLNVVANTALLVVAAILLVKQ